MGKITGFLEIKREKPKRRPVAERIHDWQEVYLPFEADKLQKQGARCMDCGIPFCHQGCPLGNLIPDWNDLVYRDRWREAHRPPARDQQLPGVHGPPLPRAVRGLLRARHQRRSRSRSSRSRSASSSTPSTKAGSSPDPPGHAHRQEGRGRRLGAGRTRRRRAAESRGPHRHRLRAVRPDRRAAPLRHSRVQDGEALPRPAAQAHGGAGIGFKTERPRGRDPAGRRRCAKTSTRSSWPAAPSGRAIFPIPGRELGGIHFAMDYLTLQNRRSEGDTVPDRDFISAKGQARRHHRRRRHRRRLPRHRPSPGRALGHQFEILPRPPDERDPESNPWPLWPNIFRVSSAHEEGGEREYSVNTTHFSGVDGRVTTLHAVAGRDGHGERPRDASGPFRAPSISMEADLVLLAMGFLGPRREGLLTDLGVKLTDRGNVWRDRNWMTSVPGRLRRRRHPARPVADRVGHRRGAERGPRRGSLPDGEERPPRSAPLDGAQPR